MLDGQPHSPRLYDPDYLNIPCKVIAPKKHRCLKATKDALSAADPERTGVIVKCTNIIDKKMGVMDELNVCYHYAFHPNRIKLHVYWDDYGINNRCYGLPNILDTSVHEFELDNKTLRVTVGNKLVQIEL